MPAASGPELAVAYVSISTSTKGLGKQIVDGVSAPADKAGKSAGSRVASAMGGALKKGVLGVGAATAGILGTAVVKGFKRLNSIDQAQAKLLGLGNSAGTVSKIMDNALKSVKGTAFGLDEAATTAAGVVAAGIKPGKQLQDVLNTVADTATIAGTSMSDMGAIFGSVAARGKLQGDDMLQLTSRGVPVLQFLAKHYGITAQAASDMVSKGKVDFKNFNEAMAQGLGGAAKKSGDTFQGAFKNMGAALSRFGAGLLAGVFPIVQKLFLWITQGLDQINAVVAPFAQKFIDAISGIFGVFTGQGSDALDNFSGPTMNKLIGAGSALRSGFDAVTAVVGRVWASLKKNLMPALREFAVAYWPELKAAAVSIGHWLTSAFKTFGSLLANQIIPALSGLLKFLAKHKTVVISVAIAVGTLVAAWKAYTFATNAWKAATEAAKNMQKAFNKVMKANTIFLVVAALTALALGLIYAYKHSETFRNIVKGAFDVVLGVGRAVANFFTKTIPDAFRATIDGIKTAFDTVVEFLKTWGPVALAVMVPFIGIPLLIFQHFKKIKGWLSGVWKSVLSGAKGFVGDIVSAITSIPGKIAGLASKMLEAGKGLLRNFMDGIVDAAKGVGHAVSDIIGDVGDGIKNLLNNILHLPWKLPRIRIGAFGKYVTVGGQQILPKLAQGGMTTGPMAALIGDNPSGRELVMPMDSPNTVKTLANALAKANKFPHSPAGGDHYEIHTLDPEATAMAIARRRAMKGRV